VRVAVVGGGAVGLGLSSCLLEAGESLHLQVRGNEAAAALGRAGLARSGIFGSTEAPAGSFTVGTQPADLVAAAPDFVLVCIKTTARDAVAAALGEIWSDLPGPPTVVLCGNGWGSAEHLSRVIPEEHIFNATVTTGFRRDDWNRVEITVHGDDIHIGSLFGAAEQVIEPLCAAIARGGIPCSPSSTMERELWAKLLYNCALNPLAALMGVPYGAVAEQPESRAMLSAVVEEIFAILAATGRETRWESADDYLEFFFGELLPQTRDHESSMLQDLRAGRPTEIDALCGAVAALGVESGIPAPVNDALATLVRALNPRDTLAA
jgi:2-dehydropantoate 2-reductase